MKKIAFVYVVSLILILVSCANPSSSTKVEVKEKIKVRVVAANMEELPIEQAFTSVLEPASVSNIISAVGERIEKINVEVSDFVKKGQELVQMNSLKYEQARLKNIQQRKEYERLLSLSKEGAVSAQNLENMALALEIDEKILQELKRNTFITASEDAVVSAKNYYQGDIYSGAMPILRLEQIQPLKLHVAVSEAFYSFLSKKNKVRLSIEAFPGQSFEAKIVKIYPVLDALSHTVNLELEMDNKAYHLRPGMFARVNILFTSRENIVIPDVSVLTQQGSEKKYVYVIDSLSRAVMRFVTVGIHQDNKIEILSGLSLGDRIIVEGQHSLKDGQEVELIENQN